MTQDLREDIINEITTLASSYGVSDVRGFKSSLYITLQNVEVLSRNTEIAVIEGDENETLKKKFLIAKMIKGCTERTLTFYDQTLKKVLEVIGKNVSDITADDLRLYFAIRLKKDAVSDVTTQNEQRVLSSFFDWLDKEELIEKNPMIKVDRIKL